MNERRILDFDFCEFLFTEWCYSFIRKVGLARVQCEWLIDCVMGKIFPCLVFLAEITVIVASLAPTSSTSNLILMPHDNANIRLTHSCQIGTLILLSGTWIRYVCYKALGEFFTFEIAIRRDHKLITWGPYSWVRHPSYIGYLMVIAGLFPCIAARGGWLRESGLLSTSLGLGSVGIYAFVIVIDVVTVLRRTFIEDEILRREFPGEWDRWAKKVPYRLIPGVF
jgi:protein-S-isoprenylcysteine O-methyltransferase Ste14